MCCLAIFRFKSDFLTPRYHRIAKLQKTPPWPFWWLLASIVERGLSAEMNLADMDRLMLSTLSSWL